MTRRLFILIACAIAAAASARTAPQTDTAADVFIPADSLHLRLLGIVAEKAALQAERTDFWHRLIPKVTVSAIWGTREVLFPDPGTAYLLPKDSYRLTVSLSVDELLDFATHRSACLEHEKTAAESDEMRERMKLAREGLGATLAELDSLIRISSEETTIRESLFRYAERRFEHGKLAYEEFLRSKLDLLAAQKALISLGRRRVELLGKLRLRGGL